MDTPQTPQLGTTPEDLRTHARFIRDELAPLVASKGHSALEREDVATLSSIMFSLNAVPMTLELLRFSRIDKALRVIAMGSEWPLEIMMQAEELITKWELALGSLQSIHADLWGLGGRLDGLKRETGQKNEGIEEEVLSRINASQTDRLTLEKDLESSWIVDPPIDPREAHRYGHLGFKIGAWWINPTAAFRDGIISTPNASITANRHTAFAIIMRGSQEVATETKTGVLQYEAPYQDSGVFKLMNTISSSEREAVRVLRDCSSGSPVAPIGGLRYDGLYRITSYGISLTPPDVWHYNFTLQREPFQESLEKALVHPIAEELDDWKDYQRAKAAERGKASHKESRRTEAREMREAIFSLHEMMGGVNQGGLDGAASVNSRDCGYSRRTTMRAS